MIQWTPGLTLAEVEKQIILQALKAHQGNKTATAQALDVARNTIDNKLNLYDKEEKDYQAQMAQEKKDRDKLAKKLVHPDAKPMGLGQTHVVK